MSAYFVLLPVIIIVDHVFKLDLNLTSVFIGIFGASIGLRIASGTYKTDRSIVISDKGISGKEFLGRKRISIPFDEINIEKSKKRSIYEYLTGTHNIVDKNDFRLDFFRRIFAKEDVEEILNKCKIAPNQKMKAVGK